MSCFPLRSRPPGAARTTASRRHEPRRGRRRRRRPPVRPRPCVSLSPLRLRPLAMRGRRATAKGAAEGAAAARPCWKRMSGCMSVCLYVFIEITRSSATGPSTSHVASGRPPVAWVSRVGQSQGRCRGHASWGAWGGCWCSEFECEGPVYRAPMRSSCFGLCGGFR